jgi:Flp pilus assembly protein TadG
MLRAALPLLRRLRDDRDGSMVVEFALIGPVFIALLLGVLQAGLAMQSTNALRHVAADVGRNVAVQAQNGADLSNNQIRQIAIATAVSAPYLLNSNNISVSVQDAATQRVSGADEIELTLTYDMPSVLSGFGFKFIDTQMTHTRPIFVAT